MILSRLKAAANLSRKEAGWREDSSFELEIPASETSEFSIASLITSSSDSGSTEAFR
jgi:hypothetical protein